MKKLLAVVLALIMLMSVSAVAFAADEPIVLHVAQDFDPGSLAPYGTEGPRNVPTNMIYQSLGNIAPDMSEFMLVLAKSFEEVENNVYDIEIYDYITDSAGNHMTADDVVFSYDTYKAAGYNTQYISSLDTIEKTGDYTVRIKMKDDAKIGAIETMLEKVRIITKAAYEASPDQMATTPVGTGTYVVTDYKNGQQITYSKREDYWQTDESKLNVYQRAYADTIYLDVITDFSTQAIAMQSGQIDVSQFIPVADMINFVDENNNARPGYNVGYVLHSALFQVIYNCGENSPMHDINLRKAVAYALDSAQIMATGWGVNGHPAAAVASAYSADFEEGSFDADTYFPYDPDLAKDYLSKSSYNGETIRILVTSNFPSASATLVQAYLNAIGIKAELLIYENAMYLSMNADNTGTQYELEIAAPNSTGYICSNTYEYDKNYRENGLPHIILDDPKLQELYDTMANKSTNSPEAATEFLKYIEENVYGYGLGYRTKCCIARDRVLEVAFNEWGDLLPAACEVINK